MKLKIYRLFSKSDFTAGVLMLDDKPFCFTLEDEQRAKKVKGETRIPKGEYEVVFQKAVTPLTKKYRKRFPWFKWHLMIKDVPGFSHIYIHIGNDDEDTAGCPLVGMTADLTKPNGWVGSSGIAFKKLYDKVFPAIRSGRKVTIEIEDVG